MDRRISQQIIVAMLMFLASVVLLFDFGGEASRNKDGSKSKKIGFVENEFQNMSRRSMGDLDWSRITTDDQIYQGDLIFTNEHSVAKLNIGDTYHLTLDEMTLVKLVFNKDAPRFDLKKGSIDLTLKDPAKKVTVVVGEKEVVFSGKDSKLTIEKNENDTYKVTAVEGSFTVAENPVEKEVRAIVMNKGEILNSKESKVQRERVCVEYLSPKSLERIDLAEDSKVRFAWKSTCQENSFRVEVATDSKFKNVIRSVSLSSNEQSMFFENQPSAPLFWRVKSNLGTSVPVQSFIAIHEPKPVVIALQATPDSKAEPVLEDLAINPPVLSSSVLPERKPSNLEQTLIIDDQPNEPVSVTTESGEAASEINRFNYSLGVGLSNNRYSDGTVKVNQYSITPKISASYKTDLLNKRLRFTGNTFLTALPLNKTTVQTDPLNNPLLTDQVTMRFLGINGRACYLAPLPTNDWRLEVSAGWYFNSTLVTNGYFGYSSVNGPQLFPSLEKDFKNGSTIGSYVKYSPVSGGLAIMNIGKNFEAALGSYYLLPRKDPKALKWLVTADFSRLSLSLPNALIRSDNLTLGASLQF